MKEKSRGAFKNTKIMSDKINKISPLSKYKHLYVKEITKM